MKIRECPIIVFEGMDCSYKETNSRKLSEYFKRYTDYSVIYQSFPRYSVRSSYFVREYLNGKYQDNKYISIYSYLLDMIDWWYDISDKEVEDKSIIILDRFYLSNLYYLNREMYKEAIDKDGNIENIKLRVYMEEILDIVDKIGLPLHIDLLVKMENTIENTLCKIRERDGVDGGDVLQRSLFMMTLGHKTFCSLDKEYLNSLHDKFRVDDVLVIHVEDKDEDTVFNEIINSKEVRKFV